MVRMPGGAAHTQGTAFTARFAVYPGVISAIRSAGNGNRMSISSGASPATVKFQPLSRTPQAGSISAEQYHVAWKRSRG